ncbi:MAG TPA: copper resistance protein CopC [Gaiellaceae bacterium]|nr:copper resistance protein CopC [Gaiellaceae bacterium]
MIAAALAALAAPATASAHATLVASTPANGAVLAAAPERVLLRFSEPVETAFGSVRVYDGAARRVDDGGTTRPQAREVAVRLRRALPRGTYTVAWRVVSADSHPVGGAIVFHVGRPRAGAAGVASQVLAEQAGSRAVAISAGVVRFLTLAFLLLGVGGAGVLAIVVGGEERRVRRPLWAALLGVALLLGLVSVSGIGLQGAQASGLALDAAVRPSLFGEVLETRFGHAALARAGLALAIALVAALALRGRWRREQPLAGTALGLGLLVGATPALAGHARVEGLVAIVSDWVHVVAASAWIGGLAFLLLALWRAGGERWPLASRAVPRLSGLAVVSVAALAVTGALTGYLEVRSWSALWGTAYGRLLLLKAALVLPLLALGAYNNRVAVPRVRASVASALERRRFLRTTGVELALAACVVGVTAALVAEPPAKAQRAAQAGPVSRDAFVHPYRIDLVVDPARTGVNEIHVYLLNHLTGQPARVDEVRIGASLPAAGLGPLRLEAVPAGPGHVVVPAATFPLAGSWTLRLDIRRGAFDQVSSTLTIPIRKDT